MKDKKDWSAVMKMHPECGPCILKQAIDSPRRFTDDPTMRSRILEDAQAAVAAFDPGRMPPELGGIFHQILTKHLGDPDPYRLEKQRFNARALEVLPELRKRISASEDPFATAVRFCAAANVMDFGTPAGLTGDEDLLAHFEEALVAPIHGGGEALIQQLKTRCAHARNILYLLDNAGEIVVDRLLIELLPKGSVTAVVRSGSILNDALMEDARFAGIDAVADVIDSGLALPGTPLDRAGPGFFEHFRGADVIISKGQGNFETLNDEDAPIYFILTAKCVVVARALGCNVGDFAIVQRTS